LWGVGPPVSAPFAVHKGVRWSGEVTNFRPRCDDLVRSWFGFRLDPGSCRVWVMRRSRTAVTLCAHCSRPKGDGMAPGSDTRFFVQWRYAYEKGWWVTVAAARTRESAAAYARRAFLDARDGSGRLAGQVRIVTAAELRRMRGGKAVAEALAGIAPHGHDLGAGL
jgi:hypothetical protein